MFRFELDKGNFKAQCEESTDETLVFVDFESFYYGCLNQHGLEPDVDAWFDDVKKRGRILDVVFFADWSEPKIKSYKQKIRYISQSIIDCDKEENVTGRDAKDVTDFIMLDHIYQRLIRQAGVQQIVIFTGDRHFLSVVAFARKFQDKKIGIYSLSTSYCRALAEAADWYVSLVPPVDLSVEKEVVENINWNNQNKQDFYVLFGPTRNFIATKMGKDASAVGAVMTKLQQHGVIKSSELDFNGKSTSRLTIDESAWEMYQQTAAK
ncbi:MAG: NYN domain-containing protein [Clostridiales bacterium]|jgi:uncharacterized LabA/DUF88 family protein|nr:NYN domain-containing protein [Clostridiales bacterium]